MKLFAVTIIGLRTSDRDLKYSTSILECSTKEEAVGVAVGRTNEEYPNYLICPPSIIEIPRELMEDFLRRSEK